MLQQKQTNQKFPKLEPGEKDIYALDRAAFYSIDGLETWDFTDVVSLKHGFLSFFVMRSILHRKITSELIEVQNLNNLLKLQLYNLGFSELYTKFFRGTFFPSLIGKGNKLDHTSNLNLFSEFEPDSHFYFHKEERQKLSLSGGGIFAEKQGRVHDTVEELFHAYNLSNRKGSFFLRTARNSYFYPLDPENRSRVFYVQERNSIDIPFHFFCVQCTS